MFRATSVRVARGHALHGWAALVMVALTTSCERFSSRSEAPLEAAPSSETTSADLGPPEASEERGQGVDPAALLPIVELDGVSHPYATTLIEPGARRVYSRSPRLWIYEAPDRKQSRLGYLRAGGSAPLAGEGRPGAGCRGEFHPILPRGWVCVDARATFDAADPAVQLMAEHPPDFGRKLPYRYGTVRNPGPIFAGLPSREQLEVLEPDFAERFPRWLEAPGEIGASYAQDVWLAPGEQLIPAADAFRQRLTRDVPEVLRDAGILPGFSGRERQRDAILLELMRPKAGVALIDTFLFDGRRYGITTQLKVVPTDRLRPIRGSERHGVRIGVDADFPFALVRSPVAKYSDGSDAAYWATLELTGKQRFIDKILHYETREGKWISDRFASRIEPAKKIPGWGKRGEKWIDVNLTKQTLTLYEGELPVFVTLISSGEAGLEDHESSTATKRGIFRIHTKHVTATMSSREIGEEFELQDVPYVMYFDKEGYALHGAYWHDRFGIPKSHGCINLTPEDARRVFHWTEPRLPTGWHGVLLPLRGTVVFVHP